MFTLSRILLVHSKEFVDLKETVDLKLEEFVDLKQTVEVKLEMIF